MLTLIGPSEKQIALIDSNSLIIIQNGSWSLYQNLANEDLKVEYIEEKIFIQSPANLIHETIFKRILISIDEFVEKNKLGTVIGSRFPLVLFDKKRAEPDLFFLSKESIKSGLLTDTFFEGEPTWIIEIISPSYREHDTVTKRKQYAKLNTNEYWIIDPEFRTVEIVSFKNGEEVRKDIIKEGLLSPKIKGFEEYKISVSEIFN